MDLQEVVRLLRSGASDREIVPLVRLNRRTAVPGRGAGGAAAPVAHAVRSGELETGRPAPRLLRGVRGRHYSAPYRLVGQALWIRAGTRTVQLFTTDHALVATHDRAPRPGVRQTLLAHLPPHKVPGLVASRETCRTQAASFGPATTTLVAALLDHRPEDRLKVAQRVLGLAARVGDVRLEPACARPLHYGTPDYPTLQRILAAGLDQAPLGAPAPAPRPTGFRFARHASEFVAGLWAGTRGEQP
jgi:hypothetical protein